MPQTDRLNVQLCLCDVHAMVNQYWEVCLEVNGQAIVWIGAHILYTSYSFFYGSRECYNLYTWCK